MKTVRARITGRVQGVFYRAWTQQEATRRGLAGWVRNRRDGSVEAVFSGDEEMVDGMVRACRQGPPMAGVDGIDLEEDRRPEETGFHQRPTA